jgi:hypothetical protein
VVAKQEEEADEDELQFQFQEADQCKDAEFQFQGSNLLKKTIIPLLCNCKNRPVLKILNTMIFLGCKYNF